MGSGDSGEALTVYGAVRYPRENASDTAVQTLLRLSRPRGGLYASLLRRLARLGSGAAQEHSSWRVGPVLPGPVLTRECANFAQRLLIWVIWLNLGELLSDVAKS